MDNERRTSFPLYPAALQVLQLVRDHGVFMSPSSGEMYIGTARVVMTPENQWISPMVETLQAFGLCANENSDVRLTPEGKRLLTAHDGEKLEYRAIACAGSALAGLSDGKTFVVGRRAFGPRIGSA
jgi:hypothetical protein